MKNSITCEGQPVRLDDALDKFYHLAKPEKSKRGEENHCLTVVVAPPQRSQAASAPQAEKDTPEAQKVILVFSMQGKADGANLKLKVKTTAPFRKAMNSFVKSKGPFDFALSFRINGVELRGEDTLKGKFPNLSASGPLQVRVAAANAQVLPFSLFQISILFRHHSSQAIIFNLFVERREGCSREFWGRRSSDGRRPFAVLFSITLNPVWSLKLKIQVSTK